MTSRPDEPPVVLVHGLWMHGLATWPLRWQLQHRHGFRAHCFSYPSLGGGLQANVERLLAFVRALSDDTVHLVGHSLGGVLALRARPMLAGGRVVCLGSPLTGSCAARALCGWPGGAAMLGPMLRAAVLDAPLARWDAPGEVGVIAGRLPLGAGLMLNALSGAHDGAVTVAETRLPGITDHLVLPVSHTGLLVAPRVAAQAAWFLRHGRFRRAADPAPG